MGEPLALARLFTSGSDDELVVGVFDRVLEYHKGETKWLASNTFSSEQILWRVWSSVELLERGGLRLLADSIRGDNEVILHMWNAFRDIDLEEFAQSIVDEALRPVSTAGAANASSWPSRDVVIRNLAGYLRGEYRSFQRMDRG